MPSQKAQMAFDRGQIAAPKRSGQIGPGDGVVLADGRPGLASFGLEIGRVRALPNPGCNVFFQSNGPPQSKRLSNLIW